MRILLVGTRVLPYRHGGDKNFWLDVIHRLQAAHHDVDVVSVMVEDEPGYDFSVQRVPPVPMYLGADSRFNEEHRHLAGTNNYTSKTISLPRIERAVRRRRREFQPDVIHFMDNYGPATFGLRALMHGVPTTISAPTYNHNAPFYDLFLKASFVSFDTIVPFSEAYRHRLLELRVAADRIRRIRWGIDAGKFTPPAPADREAARKELGLGPDQFLVFWTGFTQQTDEAALRSANRTAELALKEADSGATFAFCFKPEHFRDSYRTLERPGLRVFGTAEAFHAVRSAADLLLSPIQEPHSTAAPPLVWLECLAMGIPLVTTDIPGADEAAVPGRSGFVVPSEAEASTRIQELQEDRGLHRRLQAGAREVAIERFSVDRAVDEYVELWSQLIAGGAA